MFVLVYGVFLPSVTVGEVKQCECFFQDEECLRPGETCDVSFLEKLEDTLGGHPHFVT